MSRHSGPNPGSGRFVGPSPSDSPTLANPPGAVGEPNISVVVRPTVSGAFTANALPTPLPRHSAPWAGRAASAPQAANRTAQRDDMAGSRNDVPAVPRRLGTTNGGRIQAGGPLRTLLDFPAYPGPAPG